MPIHTSSVSYHSELGCIHFLKQVLLPVRFRCTHNEFTHDALVQCAVIRKRNCAILGEWLPGVCYLRGNECAKVQNPRRSCVREPLKAHAVNLIYNHACANAGKARAIEAQGWLCKLLKAL